MRWRSSVYVFDHHSVKILKTYLTILITICLLHHQLQSLIIQILFHMVIHILQIFNRQIILVIPIVFFEDWSNHLLVFVTIWLGVHRLHELNKTYTSCLFAIEFGNDLICCLTIRYKSILGEQKLQIVWKKNSHTGRIVSIEYFFEV